MIRMSLLSVEHIQKIYQTRFSNNKVEALKDIHFSIEKGEYVAIMGESGSGKTTLLNILATLDQPTTGKVVLNEKNIQDISEKDLAVFRREQLGFVFQDFNLLDTMSVADNILLPLVLARTAYQELNDRLMKVAKEVNIINLLEKYPYELSGGQQQRVAIARALITKPSIILADEPTGALDSKSSAMILDVFNTINTNGQTVLMVTHSTTAASHAKRVLFIKDGKLYHQLFKGDRTQREQFQLISDTLTVMANRGEGDA